jgi:AraC family transcriptional regulator
MEPRITTLHQKKLIGKRLKMTFASNRTFELFRSFMPERKAITNTVSPDVFCISLYQGLPVFKPETEFEKWAAMEVIRFDHIPPGMEAHSLKGGLYAVFYYVGANTDLRIFDYIFKTWLPNSPYQLDDREHFEVLGEKYKNNDPTSEEEIWVPVKAK